MVSTWREDGHIHSAGPTEASLLGAETETTDCKKTLAEGVSELGATIRTPKRQWSLNRFYPVLINPDRNRALNGFDRNHQCTTPTSRSQEPFDAVQRTTTDSYSLTDLQERT